MRFVFCAVFLLMATSVWAQTVRTIPMQTVFVTYQENRAHWTDPVTKGPQLVTQTNGFWHGGSGSWGAIQITAATQYPTFVDSSQSMAGGCSLGQIGLDVKAAFGTWGIGNGIRHIVLPPGTPCNSQTVGTVGPSNLCTIYTVGGSFVEHETGHALGLPHAQAKYPDGSTQAYGPYSVMGNGTYGDAIRVNERQQIGVYTPTFSLLPVTTTQDVVLQLTETMTPGIKGAQFSAPGHILSAEFRGGDFLSTGVILVLNSVLQTMDPTQQNYWLLTVGKTYCDPGFVCFTTVSQTATTATVHVAVQGSVPHRPSKVTHYVVTQ